MKNTYQLGGDIFMACAFVTFMLVVVLRLLQIYTPIWHIGVYTILEFSKMCLFFSMGLSLLDLTHKKD